jgi:hypothetical protein
LKDPARGVLLLTATSVQASGSTLRRYLARWAEAGLLARVHALLVGMLRGRLEPFLDTCSARPKRGDLTGPNPADRGERGTKYHIAVDRDGVPLTCTATAANTQRRARLRAAIPGSLRSHVARPHRVRR